MGVVPHNFVLRERASTGSCLLGIGKSEENHSYLLTVEESKSLKNVDVGIPWGFEGNIYPPDVAEQRRKSQTLMQPWDIGICCLLCYRCVFSILATLANTTQFLSPYNNKLNRKLIFKETNIFRFPLLGSILAGLQPACDTVRNLSHIFYSEFPKWAQLVF